MVSTCSCGVLTNKQVCPQSFPSVKANTKKLSWMLGTAQLWGQNKSKQFNFMTAVTGSNPRSACSWVPLWNPDTGMVLAKYALDTQLCHSMMAVLVPGLCPSATDFYPSAQRGGKQPARPYVFWTARMWVLRGFPPAAPCTGRLNAATVVISWLAIPDLLNKNITGVHRTSKILFFL